MIEKVMEQHGQPLFGVVSMEILCDETSRIRLAHVMLRILHVHREKSSSAILPSGYLQVQKISMSEKHKQPSDVSDEEWQKAPQCYMPVEPLKTAAGDNAQHRSAIFIQDLTDTEMFTVDGCCHNYTCWMHKCHQYQAVELAKWKRSKTNWKGTIFTTPLHNSTLANGYTHEM
jgi:hypothetical protein